MDLLSLLTMPQPGTGAAAAGIAGAGDDMRAATTAPGSLSSNASLRDGSQKDGSLGNGAALFLQHLDTLRAPKPVDMTAGAPAALPDAMATDAMPTDAMTPGLVVPGMVQAGKMTQGSAAPSTGIIADGVALVGMAGPQRLAAADAAAPDAPAQGAGTPPALRPANTANLAPLTDRDTASTLADMELTQPSLGASKPDADAATTAMTAVNDRAISDTAPGGKFTMPLAPAPGTPSTDAPSPALSPADEPATVRPASLQPSTGNQATITPQASEAAVMDGASADTRRMTASAPAPAIAAPMYADAETAPAGFSTRPERAGPGDNAAAIARLAQAHIAPSPAFSGQQTMAPGATARPSPGEAQAAPPPGGTRINPAMSAEISRAPAQLTPASDAGAQRKSGDTAPGHAHRADALPPREATLPTTSPASQQPMPPAADNAAPAPAAQAGDAPGGAAQTLSTQTLSGQALSAPLAPAQAGQPSLTQTIATQTAPAMQQQVQQQLATAIETAHHGSGRMELRLDPPELGRVSIDFRFEGDARVSALLQADQPETAAMIRRSLDVLMRELSAAGFADIDLSMASDGAERQTGRDASPERRAVAFTHAGLADMPDTAQADDRAGAASPLILTWGGQALDIRL